MQLNNLKPLQITDIIFKSDEYLEYMRSKPKDAEVIMDSLAKYITDSFSSLELNELELKKMAVDLTDGIYIAISNLSARDKYTDIYFGVLIQHLFFALAKKNILCFYILDNRIRDDRFKLLMELIKHADFSVITPYYFDQLNYSENYTKFPSKDYKFVEKEILQSIDKKKHIVYVEKDESVNYLTNVLTIGEDYQDKYVCIFRNKSIDDSPPIWMLGTFGNYLENK